MRDTIYTRSNDLVDFAFDERVAEVFPDMIRRSVPGYGEFVSLAGLVAGEYAQQDSQCYDLGCSLGATTLAMRTQIRAPRCRIVAVDNSPAMVERCRKNVEKLPSQTPVEVRSADLRECAINDASVVVINFTLQFVAPEHRDEVLARIHAGMLPGGVLLLAEKVAYSLSEEQDFQESMHLAFKRANGYSELEISRKRTALEGVLVPDSPESIVRRLTGAGFQRCYQWMRCFNFVAFAAFK